MEKIEGTEDFFAKLQGKRVLFVSNRKDPELEDKLTKILGVVLFWCSGETRKVQSACGSILAGKYDMILGVTGFMDHSTDGMLASKAKRVGVRYIRVNKGRPTACLQALQRAL